MSRTARHNKPLKARTIARAQERRAKADPSLQDLEDWCAKMFAKTSRLPKTDICRATGKTADELETILARDFDAVGKTEAVALAS